MGLFDRLANRFIGLLDTISEHITRQELLAIGSVIGTGIVKTNFFSPKTNSFPFSFIYRGCWLRHDVPSVSDFQIRRSIGFLTSS